MKRILVATSLLILLTSTAIAQINPSYSQVTNQHRDAYLRADLLQGVRNTPDSAVRSKRMDACRVGTRYPLNDPDIGLGIWAATTQQWNRETQSWDFRGLTHAIETAIRAGKRIYLRPVTAIAGTYQCVPEHWQTITRSRNGVTRTAVNVMHEPTWRRLQEFYREFDRRIVDVYRIHIIGIDATWAGSIDGGQPSYAGHLAGSNLTAFFGFTHERLLEELQLQWDLWGDGMICHLSPNTSDEWVTQWFADQGCKARRQDSRPFRETRSTWDKAEKFDWEVILDIYEITGGSLSSWTKRSGSWYHELVRFYGAGYPQNVERAFSDVRDRKGFIWPMSSVPSKAREPQYWINYLEGPNGALNYVPGQIEAFYNSWHDVAVFPLPVLQKL